ncbi:MAG: AIR synthase [Eubacteriales bacterium]|nr:AIR synthase [Eubacteriales bacterium]
MMRRIERQNTGLMAPGQDLVAAGMAGLAGAAVLAERRRAELLSWFSADYLEEIISRRRQLRERMAAFPDQSQVMAEFSHCGITEAEFSGEGGILRTIWNLSGAYETGVEFYLRRIPVTQGTIEICERLEVNPYRLYSRDCWLLAAENGGRLAKELESRGIFAAVIGRVRTGIAREMVVQEGRGFLERPQPDELLRLIPDFTLEQEP